MRSYSFLSWAGNKPRWGVQDEEKDELGQKVEERRGSGRIADRTWQKALQQKAS